ncbi:Adhesion G protein-coupled receptor E1 [Channa argus]|uniref:Adhesion G protein-coupled receptor E1 n=1 Tax=Channa argus TaxID=215402 RepID=A0A6G1QCC6_CHAAH|nr:Adhesion G protein-coupled receptor E1 [Channa argus]
MPEKVLPTPDSYGCVDINECQTTPGICGLYANCTNTVGSFFCTCQTGFTVTTAGSPAGASNPCIDVNECLENICGNGTCTNNIGSYVCICNKGYYFLPGVKPSCQDVDECLNATVCGPETTCTNIPASYTCACKGQTKVEAFLGNINGQLKNNSELVIPGATVINSLSASMVSYLPQTFYSLKAVSGIGPHATSAELSSAGDGKTGNAILGITHNLVSIMYQPGQNQSQTTVTCTTVDLSLKMVKTESNSNEENSVLSAKENTMQINMEALARNNNGFAAVAFLTITGMESLLSHEYFHTENLTEMYSDVITAILPSVNNTNLTEPVNFTIQHKKTVSESGMMTCVYWEDTTNEPGGGNTMGWSVKGCWATFTNENYTVCSCSHLSTFALILQIAEPQPDESFLEWLNRMCVIVGLFFFALAILTFLLCSWNPKINNTARLHLCINLALSQLLLLWNSNYVDQKLACKVMAGLLHFLVVASFVWMQLEALQLHLLVRRLSKVQVIQRDGLPRPLLYLVGYGVPFVIVGVSALVYSDGYGATNGQCWLSTNRRFNWALTGPVITILGLNCALFGATLWSLRPTLASMRSDVSQSKDTRLILFKILAQFVILGCTWILGLYQANLFFKVMFIILNSQQGTFLYIVHCLLNKEVREEYIKWLTCSFNKPREGLLLIPVTSDFPPDIDECQMTLGICGPYATCTNIFGSYICTCLRGFTATDAALPPGTSNPCIDIDPCLKDICGNGTCYSNPGNYECDCDVGFQLAYDASPVCQDVDECQMTLSMCGPYSTCTNTFGSYICTCFSGFIATDSTLPPGSLNQCTEVDECVRDPSICGPNSNCTNSIGSYFCGCLRGYRQSKPNFPPSVANPCEDLHDFVQAITPAKTVANFFSACMEVSGVGSQSGFPGVSSDGDGDGGSVILDISERLVSQMLSPTGTPYTKTLVTPAVVSSNFASAAIHAQDLSLLAIGPEDENDSGVFLFTKENSMEINLHAIASANNGSAAVALLTLNGMQSLLSHQYFQTENKTEMYSDILTVILPSVKNKIITTPVNFTIQHKTVPKSGIVTCVYWEDNSNNQAAGQGKRWSVDGCWVAHSDENYTVCSCSHLSTFALIMQIGEAPPPNPFLDWLNRICVIIGLFFLALAILTFLLCSWNAKINNTARLHLCINLALSQLLLLFNSTYVNYPMACKAYAGLLHFLIIASFVWMLLEALQLYLLVRKLSKVQIIQRDGLPKLLLYLIGYGVPFVIVGVSALVYSNGYGATDAQVCWLSTKRNFNWALTGPVIVILALNLILFCATLWSLRPTLANMKSDVSQSKDTRLIMFKILAQFVILGCPWLLGLYQTNIFFQILFIILNSQQGTFLYIVHCLLNKEVVFG